MNILPKQFIILGLFIITSLSLLAQKKHKTTKIGNQTWIAENLNSDHFQNGELIPEASTNSEWSKANDKKQPVWCYPSKDSARTGKYGKLYNWYAVNDPRGIAPKGWHIPEAKEFDTLLKVLGGAKEAYVKLKDSTGWTYSLGITPFGNNSSGFCLLPVSSRGLFGGFNNSSSLSASLWSATKSEKSESQAYYYSANDIYTEIYKGEVLKVYGLSVRCIKN